MTKMLLSKFKSTKITCLLSHELLFKGHVGQSNHEFCQHSSSCPFLQSSFGVELSMTAIINLHLMNALLL